MPRSGTDQHGVGAVAEVDAVAVLQRAPRTIFQSAPDEPNGVVQIFTKKGRGGGQPTVTASTDFRDNSLRKKVAWNNYPFAFANTTTTDLTQVPVTRYDLQSQIFANDPEQRGIRWRVSKVALTVDRQIRHGWVSPLLYGRTY